MATVVKAIKPARLKVAKFRMYMLNALTKFGTKLKREYQKTTTSWTKKPVFETLVSLAGEKFTVLVDTNDKIFAYVDKGTRPHEIWAGIYTGKSKKRFLRFNTKSYAKTFPGVLASVPGGSFPPVAFRPMVHHPGNKPRDFTKNIERLQAPQFRKFCEEAMRQFARNSGNSMGR